MPVPIEREQTDLAGWPLERCCICREPTPFWTRLPNRAPGEQVALCPHCASHAQPTVIPSKATWCHSERLLDED